MAKDTNTAVDTTASDTAATGTPATAAKKTRSPSAPKAVFAVVVIKDENGNPVKLDKAQVEVISFEKSAEKVLEVIDSGAHPGAIYLRGMLPAGR